MSELVREAVNAYVMGDMGAPFDSRCSRREAHRPGFKCIMCGGTR